MKNLESLFVEFNCTTIESLLTSIGNRIDWYTWAQIRIDSLKELDREIYKLYVQNGADNDIDICR